MSLFFRPAAPIRTTFTFVDVPEISHLPGAASCPSLDSDITLVDVLAEKIVDEGPTCAECNEPCCPLPIPDALDQTYGIITPPISDAQDAKITAATRMKEYIVQQLRGPDFHQRKLCIVGILATDDEGSKTYAKRTAEACQQNRVYFELIDLSAFREEEDGGFDSLSQGIHHLNSELKCDGVLIYFPIFGDERDADLRSLVSPRIDAEGISPSSLEHSYARAPAPLSGSNSSEYRSTVYPCTPVAIFRLLEQVDGVYNASRPFGAKMKGKVVTVINRSETVGRPLAAMLANEGALVFSTDAFGVHAYERHSSVGRYCVRATNVYTEYKLGDLLASSDVIVSAVPGTYKIPTASVKMGAICINVASGNNFEDDIEERAAIFVKRMGSLTILTLQLNALALRQKRSPGT